MKVDGVVWASIVCMISKLSVKCEDSFKQIVHVKCMLTNACVKEVNCVFLFFLCSVMVCIV